MPFRTFDGPFRAGALTDTSRRSAQQETHAEAGSSARIPDEPASVQAPRACVTSSGHALHFALTSLALTLALSACGDDGGDTTTDAATTDDTSTGSTTGEPTTAAPTTGPTSTGATSTGEPGTSTTSTGEPGTSSTTADETTGDENAPIVVGGFSHPESILIDPVDGVYLVSNIGGNPDAVDDNGFISRVLPDGTVEGLQWISGETGDFTLDAPKGMAIVDDILYVADITAVRKFDRVTGEHLGDIEVEGAAFLNDLSPDADGNVYVSDTNTQSIHKIDPQDAVSLLITDDALAGPNGLYVDGSVVMVVGYNGQNIWRMGLVDPMPYDFALLPQGGLDGIVRTSSGWLVSSWDGEAVYYNSDIIQRDVETVVEGIGSPADIDYDSANSRVLVPRLLADTIEFHHFSDL
ncbi:SMP-30/gluconolactonase/LRE family protein [Nannocystis pusilla]|uniref:SMP-30/gluconolactonase/LRE family protein n=1 Tax=Nannocystis pusilla TaxID=889268 RepID=UPI003B8246CD